MPALSWTITSTVEPHREYLVMASVLPLDRYRDVPTFLRGTLAIRRQLAQADGLVGFALDAKLLAKKFWTLSVWRDEQALQAFTRSQPHADIAESTRPHMGSTAFVTWKEAGTAVPVPWARARQRIADGPGTPTSRH